jgi:hypothetical protein
MYKLVCEYGVLESHYPIMERNDFWAIFPVEGKFVMASEFNRKRKMAVLLMRWRLF